MRHTLWLVIVAAGISEAQWRHFGEGSVPREMLTAHNAARARVGVAPLAWSGRLAAHAQDWADTLMARGEFAHRPHSGYGENLFEITGARATSSQVVSAWAEEARDYDYRSNKCHGVCGHYTQIVWGDTREVGWARVGPLSASF